MNKMVFVGDSLLTGEQGYYPLVEAKILLDNPATEFLFECIKKDCETYGQIFNQSSAVIIGRAPQHLFLSLGIQDIYSAAGSLDILNSARNTLELLKDKTGASIFLTNAATILIGADKFMDKCNEFNQGLNTICEELDINLINLDAHTKKFLNEHRVGSGEKRSLHKNGPELYPMGQMLMAELIYNRIKQEVNF